MTFAHSRNSDGHRHELVDHLLTVAELAEQFATPFGGAAFGWWAGRLHDIGKASPAFQAYLAACEREPHRRHPTVDHKGAGTLACMEICQELAFLIQGHHGGLPDRSALRTKLKELVRASAHSANPSSIGAFTPDSAEIKLHPAPVYPPFAQTEPGFEFFLRMCFSALVDADHRDTEQHFRSDKSAGRGGTPSLATLARRLEEAQDQLTGQRHDPVNQVRDEVYRACLQAATLSPGFFRLTVPTGGGKTRSGLAFALQHALLHDLDRVIVAVPFLTITDQTADVFRAVLGDDRAVLEHHSGADATDDEIGAPTARAIWRRLAAEDWDAPVIVTTTVQFFESLFSRKTTACRKLHRIARAVVILDEAQTFPPGLLNPILTALTELVENYGTSVVFCTATQPAFARAPGFADLDQVREIAPDPPRLFRMLKRVAYELPGVTEQWTWDDVAAQMCATPQALTIVNTKSDALALVDAVGDPQALHLSTLLCGAHRRDILAIVRHRLAMGEPCHVVSTQVVEAGVDIDFPVVLRAIGPLDRIVQAAGRCNREGLLAAGRLVVFDPVDGHLPPGAYRTATDITRGLLAQGIPDLDDPELFERYFGSLFPVVNLDQKGIQALRRQFEFARVADAFRMIDDDSVSVVVRYRGMATPTPARTGREPRGDHDTRSRQILTDLRDVGDKPDFARIRPLLRRAQPYVVSVRRRALAEAADQGLVSELVAGLWAWEGGYDDVRGLSPRRPVDDFVV